MQDAQARSAAKLATGSRKELINEIQTNIMD